MVEPAWKARAKGLLIGAPYRFLGFFFLAAFFFDGRGFAPPVVPETMDAAIAGDVDYSMLVKIYGPEQGGAGRYSPAACTGCKRRRVRGRPDPKHVSTSYAERQNLTMRMNMRRFTRLTNAFSKKLENLNHAVALHFMHYNFCRVHMSLNGLTPAMAAGKADHVWTLEEVVGLLEPAKMLKAN